MRLSKAIARTFVCIRGNNLFSVACRAMGCKLLEPGSNFAGNVTNIWSYPAGASGRTEKVRVRLTPGQRKKWNNRHQILQECQDKASDIVATIRKTLAGTTESEDFKSLADSLTEAGERRAVESWRKNPTKMTKTKDGDILHPVARLPARLRRELLIDGHPVSEYDVKSAHATLLGMFYSGKSGSAWIEERTRFMAEAAIGFESLYGADKQHKKAFLSALNQPVHIARHSSEGYRTLDERFPLLADEIASFRANSPKRLGALLRSTLASAMAETVAEIHRQGLFALPVTDSLIIAKTTDQAGGQTREILHNFKVRLEAACGVQPIVLESTNSSPAPHRADRPRRLKWSTQVALPTEQKEMQT